MFSYVSTQAMIKNTPGLLAPPVKSRPSLNITARSYSYISFMLGRIIYISQSFEHVQFSEQNSKYATQISNMQKSNCSVVDTLSLFGILASVAENVLYYIFIHLKGHFGFHFSGNHDPLILFLDS